MDNENSYKYNAFISYRHCEPDKSIAERLHRMLECFRVPKPVSKVCGKKHLKRVFRDRDELTTSANLADNITEALKESEFLIVICSPRTPQSQWVIKEIEDFKAIHGHNRIFALLIEGDPDESFPKQLCYVKDQGIREDGSMTETIINVEPLAADIRASSEKEMYKKLRTEMLRLLAPMLNCGFDDLKQRHRERRIKAILTTSISVSVFFIAFGAYSMYQSLVISQKNQEISKKNEEIVSQIKKTQISQSRYLADISSRLLEEGDRYRAVMVACEALPKDLAEPEKPYVEEAEFALSNALGVYDIDSMYDMDLVLDHKKTAGYVKLSPNGKTLISLSSDGYTNIWDMESGNSLSAIFTDHSPLLPENSVTFVDDNSFAAANSENITCFDLEGAIIWQRDISSTRITASGKGKLASSSYRNLIVLDSSTGETIIDIDLQKYMDTEAAGSFISCIRFNGTGDMVGMGTSLGKVFIFDAVTGDLINSYNTTFQYVSDLAFSPEGYIAAASNEFRTDDLLGRGKGALDIYPPSGSYGSNSIEFSHSAIDNVQFYPTDPGLVILSEGENLNVVDIKSRQIVYSFISGDNITDYEIFEGLIVTSSLDGSIRFCFLKSEGYESDWHRITRPDKITGLEIGSGRIAITCQGSKKVYIMRVMSNENSIALTEHSDTIRNTALSPDGSLSVSSCKGGELMLCNIPEHKVIKTASLGGNIIECRFVNDERIIAVLEDEGIILLDKALQPLKHEMSDTIFWVSFNADNTLFAIGSGSQMKVCSTEDLAVKASAETGYSVSCTFSADNRILLVDRNNSVKLIDPYSGNETIISDDSNIITGSISSDGKKYAVAYGDKTIRLYDTESSTDEPVTMNGSANVVARLFFSPDSKILFAGYDDSSIEVFSALDGTLITDFSSEHFSTPLKRVIFSRDGTRIACIDEANYAVILNSSTFKILSRAKISSIDKEFGKILSYWDSKLMLIPVYTPQMLIDEAKKQLNGRTLTESEKVDMFIEQ